MISIFMLAVSFASMSAAKKSTVRKTSGKKTTVKKVVKKEEEKSPMIGMSNPASVYCVEQGGESILVRSKKGDFGICKLKDGTAVEEWEYYRQNNTPQSLEAEMIGTPNPAAKFCVDKGGKSITVKDRKGNEKGVCKFKILYFLT